MRRLVAFLCAAAVTFVPGRGRADCAAPSLRATPATVRAGGRVLLTGEHWTSACNDTAGGCLGLGGEREVDEIQGVSLELVMRGSPPVELRSVDLTEAESFAVKVRIPPTLEPGSHTLRARAAPTGDLASADVTVVAR